LPILLGKALQIFIWHQDRRRLYEAGKSPAAS
jgi:hypothetical protein